MVDGYDCLRSRHSSYVLNSTGYSESQVYSRGYGFAAQSYLSRVRSPPQVYRGSRSPDRASEKGCQLFELCKVFSALHAFAACNDELRLLEGKPHGMLGLKSYVGKKRVQRVFLP